jgi:hypothetical protein
MARCVRSTDEEVEPMRNMECGVYLGLDEKTVTAKFVAGRKNHIEREGKKCQKNTENTRMTVGRFG